VAITEVIAGNTIPTKNHLISLENVFGLNPKQLKINCGKGWVPRHDDGGDGSEEQAILGGVP
jgi:hypothetical protein